MEAVIYGRESPSRSERTLLDEVGPSSSTVASTGARSTQPPSEYSSPDWTLNLALGGTLAVMLALFVPFLVEGVSNALEERRKKDGE